MRTLLRPLLLAVVLALAACATRPAPAPALPPAAAAPAPLVTILVSIDGFRADYLNRGVTPTLSRLAASGAHAPAGLQPAFPTITFPNHYTLVTGLPPGRHGVINNTMADPAIPGVLFTLGNREAVMDRRWYDGATPIWVTAERAGQRTATMFWPGSEAAIQGVRPSDWRVFQYGLPADARVDQVLAWLARPVETRPLFVTLYFEAVDTAGHRHGPDAADTNEAVRATDAALGRLTAALDAGPLAGRVNLVIVSDHGMRAIDPGRTIALEDLVDPAALGAPSGGGPVLTLTPAPGREAEVAAALARPHPHAQCWPKAALPDRFAYSAHARIPPFVCLAAPGWWIAPRAQLAQSPPSGGAHGYDPEDPQMAGLFIGHGPAFRPGAEVSGVRAEDVYPLLARLIGAPPEPNAGRLEPFAAALLP